MLGGHITALGAESGTPLLEVWRADRQEAFVVDPLHTPATFVALAECAPDPIVLTDYAGTVHFVNQAFRDLVGLAPETDASSVAANELFGTDRLAPGNDTVVALRARGAWTGECELRHVLSGGSIPVLASTFTVPGTDGTELIASIARDLRPTREQERTIRSALESEAALAREQRAIADIGRLALRANLAEILDHAVAAALESTRSSYASIVRESEPHPGVAAEAGIRPPNGRRIAVTVDAELGPWGAIEVHAPESREWTDADTTFLRTLADVLSAAVHRDELESRLRRRGMHDALTGLPNRSLVHEHLGAVLGRPRAAGRSVAVLLVDFDNFKSINDHFGHDIGDIALVAVARRLRDAVARITGHDHTTDDTVARLGGDEFLVVCENVEGTAEAERIALSIGAALRVPLTIEGRSVPLSASIGIALAEKNIGVSQLVHRADVAMYRAKAGAPGTHAVYDADDGRQTRHHLTMSTDLRAAIESDALTLTYVPMIDTGSGAVTAFWARPVWDHPALGILEADEFVTTAERTGLIEALGAWILRGACREATRWSENDGAVCVRVDVVSTQIRQEGFVGTIAAALHSTGLPADRLIVSVPESALVPADDAVLHAALTDLHALGVRLLLDNSSGGHSSIRNLQQFPEFEFFQLDSGDVDATFREHSAVVLQAVVALIHAIGARVVAGNVDSHEHLAGVTAVGCDVAHGALSGGPVPGAETVAVLARSAPARSSVSES